VYAVAKDRAVDSGGLGTLAIDQKTRMLYGAGIKVIDIDHDTIVGELPASFGHGYAFADELGLGVTRRGVIFDLKTHAMVRRGAEWSAAAVAYDRTTRRAAIDFDSVSIVNVKTAQIAGTIPVGASESVISDGKGHFFVDLDSDTIVVIDARQLITTHRWGLGKCRSPAGMAIDSDHRRLFISCGNRQLVVLNATNGNIVMTLAGGWSGDQLAFDAKSHLLFIPTEHDTLEIVRQDSPDSYRLVSSLYVGPIRSAVAVDETTHNVYLVHNGCRVPTDAIVCLVTVVPSAGLGRQKSASQDIRTSSTDH
jgi:hypothetical protein